MSTSTFPDVTAFKALSFDCYGTLVDYESSLRRCLVPLQNALPPSHPLAQDQTKLMQRFNALSDVDMRENGTVPADEIYERCFCQLVRDLGLKENQFTHEDMQAWRSMAGKSVPFADTIAGLQKLERHFKLIILSNVDEHNITSSTASMSPVRFAAVYTAERIGSFKPSHANFRFLFQHARDELGVDFEKGELLHVARSLKADHVPAKELGLRSVWIARGGDSVEGQGVGGDPVELEGRLAYEWKFQGIGEFADEVERQFREKGL